MNQPHLQILHERKGKPDDLQFSINIYRFSHRDLHLPDFIAGLRSLLAIRNWWFEFIAPWAPPAVAVTIVVTQQIITAGLVATTDLERLVNRAQEIFRKVGRKRADAVEICGSAMRGKAAEKISSITSMYEHHIIEG